ncbi:hypothetical protein [Paraflavitalea sp. CAU 1676]|uniref:hypothetical protein n=1 Tax=Paraflavitalea sp. CAU 1676 TaxID=3032598 RepID=UPI0023DB2BEB|nr:hypothetical protein [Paraflavitalea sp. CAU 1676]MDF2192568.1 hypothetical protein [Paraflavitalea sp. CAU 1676]
MKKKVRMDTWAITSLILVFLGGIIGAIGQSRGTSKDKNEIMDHTTTTSDQLQSKIIELQNENHKLTNSIKERDQKIGSQNEEIIVLNRKLVDKSEYIENYLTSKKAHPNIILNRILGNGRKSDKFCFYIENKSEYPIYDIKIEVFDYNKLKQYVFKNVGDDKQFISIENYMGSVFARMEYNSLSPKSIITCQPPIDPVESIFYVKIHTRNATFIEKIVFHRVGQSIYVGTTLYDLKWNVLNHYVYEEAPNKIRIEIEQILNEIPNELTYYFTN